MVLFITSCSCGQVEKWSPDISQWSPFMKATFNQDLNGMRTLINDNVDIKTIYHIDGADWNALTVAMKKNNLKAVKIILETGKYDEEKVINGYLKFVVGLNQNASAIIDYLLDTYNIDLNEVEKYGSSYLWSATASGSIQNMRSLLVKGADINQQREVDGITVLMIAASNDDLEKVKFLLNHGANKYLKDKNGKTALDYINKKYSNDNQGEKQLLQKILK